MKEEREVQYWERKNKPAKQRTQKHTSTVYPSIKAHKRDPQISIKHKVIGTEVTGFVRWLIILTELARHRWNILYKFH